MNLYLVQHAKAKSKEEDPDRSLSEEGWSDLNKVAPYLAGLDIEVHQLFHSGKTRARQTAEVLAKALNPDQGVSETSGLGATDEPADWAERLTSMAEDVILVGHLPHLSKLAALLVCQDQNKKVIDFQNSGVVCLGRNDGDGTWTVRWIMTPSTIS